MIIFFYEESNSFKQQLWFYFVANCYVVDLSRVELKIIFVIDAYDLQLFADMQHQLVDMWVWLDDLDVVFVRRLTRAVSLDRPEQLVQVAALTVRDIANAVESELDQYFKYVESTWSILWYFSFEFVFFRHIVQCVRVFDDSDVDQVLVEFCQVEKLLDCLFHFVELVDSVDFPHLDDASTHELHFDQLISHVSRKQLWFLLFNREFDFLRCLVDVLDRKILEGGHEACGILVFFALEVVDSLCEDFVFALGVEVAVELVRCSCE